MRAISGRDADRGAFSRKRRSRTAFSARAGSHVPSVASCVRDDARSSRDAGVGSLENSSRSEKVEALVVLSSLPRLALAPRAERATHGRPGRPLARSLSRALAARQHDRRRPPRQGASARGRRETRGARLLRDPAHLLAPRHRCVPPVPRVAHRRAHRTVRPVARATMRAERGRTRHAREGSLRLFASASRFFLPSPHRRV